jgi:hypothetical protein
MKPIKVIVLSATAIFMIGGGSLLLGWSTQHDRLVLIGKSAIAVAIAVSCIPLVALSAYGLWTTISCLLNRRD